ncbi:MAG: CPBP family intramembrane glutamic endopeptidase [Phycisphaerae bacterium]
MAQRQRTTKWMDIGSGTSYFHRTHRPLQCLVFITPLLLFYQIGALFHGWGAKQATPEHVVAFRLLYDFFHIFGAAGSYMPLAAVIAILLAWHLARQDPWDFEPKLYFGMALESILWAIPVFVIGLAIQQRAAAGVAGGGGHLSWQSAVVISVGAGVYEELIFRLITITLLNLILVDIFEFKIAHAIPIIILVSAILFAAYHKLGDNPVSPSYFLFLMAFGVYSAGIFIFRGFGIAVGMHALYDLIVVAAMSQRGQ